VGGVVDFTGAIPEYAEGSLYASKPGYASVTSYTLRVSGGLAYIYDHAGQQVSVIIMHQQTLDIPTGPTGTESYVRSDGCAAGDALCHWEAAMAYPGAEWSDLASCYVEPGGGMTVQAGDPQMYRNANWLAFAPTAYSSWVPGMTCTVYTAQ